MAAENSRTELARREAHSRAARMLEKYLRALEAELNALRTQLHYRFANEDTACFIAREDYPGGLFSHCAATGQLVFECFPLVATAQLYLDTLPSTGKE